ncbi:MAG: ATP-binding cassette domain-containing protein [Verrucomicrobiota bacterium]
MSGAATPSIQMSPGLEIGYGSALARLDEEVVLGGGTHFLLARNGRGKTTLLRTLAGSHQQVAGKFRMTGFVQYLPEDLRFDPEVPAKSLFHVLLPKAQRAAALALAERIELDVKKPYGRLSTGNRRKTSLIIAEYSVRPTSGNILLLDEPLSGLDVFARQTFEEIWQQSGGDVLRLVSCHPDYDAMALPSTLLIEGGKIRHLQQAGQSWSGLKKLL